MWSLVRFWRELVVVCLCFFIALVFRDYISTNSVGAGQVHYVLVVGILSARGNFNVRESLRKTWVGHAKINRTLKEKVLVKFIISDKACMIPPEYRSDPYRCEENVVEDLVLDKSIISYTIPAIEPKYFYSGPCGRDFNVRYPIIITSLGISASGLTNNTIVRLYDKTAKKEIVNATFTMEDSGTFANGSWFKTVPNFILPKGFEATIVSENFNSGSQACDKEEEFIDINNGGGLIDTPKVKRFGDEPGIFPEKEETIYDERCPYSAAAFIYKAHGDVSSNVPSNQDKVIRLNDWKSLKDRESRQLFEEAKLNLDILFVPNIDVYRNVPSQLLGFYQWVSENASFSFTLKTDDDCFVDIEAILKAINHHKLGNMSKVWWSRFRTDWLIDRQGKWAEPDYPGVTYPTFACGAGNVLSADLVHWLTKNGDSLKRYQGEDVSMGIWLSAVGPNILMDYRWSCFQECFQEMFTSPEQDTESLHDMWDNFQSCGNPCSC